MTYTWIFGLLCSAGVVFMLRFLLAMRKAAKPRSRYHVVDFRASGVGQSKVIAIDRTSRKRAAFRQRGQPANDDEEGEPRSASSG